MIDDDWDAQHAYEEGMDDWYDHLRIEHAKGILGWRERPKRAAPPYAWLSVADAAARLSVSERTVRELLRSGELAYVDTGTGKVRAQPRIKIEDLREFEDKRRGQGKWRSSKEEESTTTTSSYAVLNFEGLLAARQSAKPAPSSVKSGKRRKRRAIVVKLSDVARR
jgi:excisionase family DNA binding protein